jgi:LmbE family N-acetylglucosaminyl deacetylase
MMRYLQSRLTSRPDWFDGERLTASAVVFAPHPDDETLGCGGTMARKAAAGASIHVVVLTDGSGTKAGRPHDEHVALRRAEAVTAMARLGVGESNLRFLDFPDGGLEHAGGALPDAVGTLLLALRPAQVFVPYRSDGHPDHEAAFHAVRAAIKSAGLRCELYEYPVWTWRHWPWVPLRLPFGDELPPVRATLKFLGGWRFVRTFSLRSDITAALEAKRGALTEYRSQLGAASGGAEPWALDRVSRGDWLRNLDTGYEVFRASRPRP